MPHIDRPQPDDPLESLNRAVFDTNTALDTALIKPIAETYRVSGIVSALVSGDAVEFFRKNIDNLAFTFVAPLDAYDCDIAFH